MTFRAAALLVVLAGIPGCYGPNYLWRQPCEPEAVPGTCCPVGSHEVIDVLHPEDIVCGADDPPCDDAGEDAGACFDAGTDAH